jgi:hypothetical protein
MRHKSPNYAPQNCNNFVEHFFNAPHKYFCRACLLKCAKDPPRFKVLIDADFGFYFSENKTLVGAPSLLHYFQMKTKLKNEAKQCFEACRPSTNCLVFKCYDWKLKPASPWPCFNVFPFAKHRMPSQIRTYIHTYNRTHTQLIPLWAPSRDRVQETGPTDLEIDDVTTFTFY